MPLYLPLPNLIGTIADDQTYSRWSHHRRSLHQDPLLCPDPRFLGWYRNEHRTSFSPHQILHTDLQPEGDSGGELDPHGPDAVGNPIGGNVTSDVSGEDVFYEEVSIIIAFWKGHPLTPPVDVVHLVRPVLSPNLYRPARGLYHRLDV